MNKYYKDNRADFYFPFPYELGFADTCKWISVIDFIIDCINSNNYLHTMINYFYVPISKHYNKFVFNHDVLVYGYDSNEEMLYILDFFNDGKYTSKRISFSDFNQAFSKCNILSDEDYLHGMVRLYKFNNKYDYKFNIKNIVNSIRSYLFSNIPEYWDIYNTDDMEDTDFGVEIYTTLKNYIINKMSKGEDYIDRKPFYMLYDHKKIMCLRLKYLNEQGYFKKYDNNNNIIEFTKIETKAKIMVELIIKYNISKNTDLMDRIISLLDDIEKREYDILKQYIVD